MNILTIPRKLNKDLKIFIMQTVSEFLNDPDFGLVLTGKAKKRLRQETVSKKKPVSFLEIKRKYQ